MSSCMWNTLWPQCVSMRVFGLIWKLNELLGIYILVFYEQCDQLLLFSDDLSVSFFYTFFQGLLECIINLLTGISKGPWASFHFSLVFSFSVLSLKLDTLYYSVLSNVLTLSSACSNLFLNPSNKCFFSTIMLLKSTVSCWFIFRFSMFSGSFLFHTYFVNFVCYLS